MKNILVTGGAGFIGSHLCEHLLRQGNRVIIVDNFNDYYDPDVKRKNIEEIKKSTTGLVTEDENLLIYEADIRNKKDIQNICNNRIDLVIHLAAMAGVRYSIQVPELYYDVNINGTLNILEECRKHKINNFIFASSSSVYGNNNIPFSESDIVDYPLSPYAATKKSGELLCHTYHHLYGINMAALRFFTVYGPRQRPDLAIHKFVKLIMNDKEVPLYGDGTTERDYTHIDDIIDGISKTVLWLGDGRENKFEIFNLGESGTVSLKEMVRLIESYLNKKAKIVRLPLPAEEVVKTCADISKARGILGYNPTKKFEDGLKDFIEWIKTNN